MRSSAKPRTFVSVAMPVKAKGNGRHMGFQPK